LEKVLYAVLMASRKL
jgi:hypothetical protein